MSEMDRNLFCEKSFLRKMKPLNSELNFRSNKRFLAWMLGKHKDGLDRILAQAERLWKVKDYYVRGECQRVAYSKELRKFYQVVDYFLGLYWQETRCILPQKAKEQKIWKSQNHTDT